jgi:hypothetical protein
MRWFYTSVLICCFCLTTLGQIRFQGVLLKDDKTPKPIPVGNTRVVIAGVGGKLTGPNGKFTFDIPNGWPSGKMILIDVNKPGFIVNDPVDGKWTLPSLEEQNIRVLNVIIVPRGSKKLWSNQRIENYIGKLAEQVDKQRKELASLREETSKPKPVDFTPYFKEWASKTGFTPEVVKELFDEWARSPDNPNSHSSKALKDFYNGKYIEAAGNFKAAADDDIETAKRLQGLADQKLLDGSRNLKRSGVSLIFASEFGKALESFEEVRKYVSEEKYPDEVAELLDLIGIAKKELGIRREGKEGVTLLAESVVAHRQALEIANRINEPELLATIEANLAGSLYEQAIRVEGQDEKQLLNESEMAFRHALEIKKGSDKSTHRAKTLSNLGWILTTQAIRRGGEAGQRLFSEALDLYRLALDAQAREQSREAWAHTEGNLAGTLLYFGLNKRDEDGKRMLAESAATYNNILEVFTREKYPELWAQTKSALGWALAQQGQFELPGEAGDRFLDNAVADFRDALEIQTREKLPQAWAITQINLGGTLYLKALRHGYDDRLLNEAAEAYHQASAVNTREHLPQLWALIQSSLGAVRLRQAEVAQEESKLRLLKEVIKLDRLALQVFTRERQPREWIGAQDDLGRALYDFARFSKGADSSSLIREAISLFRELLDFISPSSYPQEWMVVQGDLAAAYYSNKDWANAADAYASYSKRYPKDFPRYLRASYLYRDVLFAYEKAYELGQLQWQQQPPNVMAQTDSLESCFSAGHFTECDTRISLLLAEPQILDFLKIKIRAIKILNLIALGKTNLVSAEIDALIKDINVAVGIATISVDSGDSTEPEDRYLDGVLHFINQSEPLTPYRTWLTRFIAVVKKDDADEMVKGLNELRVDFKARN